MPLRAVAPPRHHREAIGVSGRNHGLQALAVAFAVVVASVAFFALHADGAASAFRASAAVTSVARAVTVDAVIIAREATTAQYAGVCFDDADGHAVDFPLQRDVRLTTVAVPLHATGTLTTGRYTFAACVRVGDAWSSLGAVGRIDVSDDTAPRTVSTDLTSGRERLAALTPTSPASSATAAPAVPGSPRSTPTTPAAVPAPVDTALPVGDLPGWRQVLAEDFSTPLAEGRFPGRPYRDQWLGYDGFTNPSGTPLYDTKDVTSVHDGLLDVRVREDDAARGAGLVALPDGEGSWGGRVYGRYSVRVRFDAVPEWGAAVLLWSDRNVWEDGEIDFAEGGTDATIGSYSHRLDAPALNDLAVQTTARWQDWHIATVEWTASGVTFLMDGKVTGHTRTSPTHPLHLVIQTIRTSAPLAARTGHLQVDWVAAWQPA